MRNSLTTIQLFLSFCVLSTISVDAQNGHWYVLQSMEELSDSKAKIVMSEIQSLTNAETIWFNGTRSGTIGVRHSAEIDWNEVVHFLISHQIYLADITNGISHQNGNDVRSGFYFSQAIYCAIEHENAPVDFYAKLNQAEWDALPEEVRNYYVTNSHYVISE
jgi:hypothetical protein